MTMMLMGTRGIALDPHESPLYHAHSLGVLAVGALFAGVVFSHDFIGEGAGRILERGALSWTLIIIILEAREDIPAFARQLPTLMMVVGFLVAVLFYVLAPSIPEALGANCPAAL